VKPKSLALVETSKTITISSKVSNVESLDSIPREERKREASKPLYLVRYE
jgi:hypothetical protein